MRIIRPENPHKVKRGCMHTCTHYDNVIINYDNMGCLHMQALQSDRRLHQVDKVSRLWVKLSYSQLLMDTLNKGYSRYNGHCSQSQMCLLGNKNSLNTKTPSIGSQSQMCLLGNKTHSIGDTALSPGIKTVGSKCPLLKELTVYIADLK